MTFTVVFSGDIRKFATNPFQVETAFGKPLLINASDLADECGRLTVALERIVDARMPGEARRIALEALDAIPDGREAQ